MMHSVPYNNMYNNMRFIVLVVRYNYNMMVILHYIYLYKIYNRLYIGININNTFKSEKIHFFF